MMSLWGWLKESVDYLNEYLENNFPIKKIYIEKEIWLNFKEMVTSEIGSEI